MTKEQDEDAKIKASKDRWFKYAADMLEKLREDDTVVHIVIIGMHESVASVLEEFRDPDAPVKTVSPVTFIHNLGDNLNAAITVNNVAAMIAMTEQQNEAHETRN